MFYPYFVGFTDRDGFHDSVLVAVNKSNYDATNLDFLSNAISRSITPFIYMAYNQERAFENGGWQDTVWGFNPRFERVWPLIQQSYIIQNTGNPTFASRNGSVAAFPQLLEDISSDNLALIGNVWFLNPEE